MTDSLDNRDGVIWFDGELPLWREARVHVPAHALHDGPGAFEGVRAYGTGTVAKLLWISELDGRVIGSGSRGTEKLQSKHFDPVMGKRDGHPEWSTVVNC